MIGLNQLLYSDVSRVYLGVPLTPQAGFLPGGFAGGL